MSFPFFICVVPLFFFYVYESHTNMKWFVWYLANINLLQMNRVKKCDSKKWTTFTICLVDKIIGFYKARSLLCLGLERLCLLCVFFFKDVELYSYHRIDEAAPESKEEI